MELENIRYVKISYYADGPIVVVENINEFVELIKAYNSKFVFVKLEEKREEYDYNIDNGYFILSHEGIAFKIKNKNYKTISDMIKGTSNGFSDADKYYDAVKRGFIDYNEYNNAIQLGYENRDDYLYSQEMGFRGSLEDIKNIELDKYDSYNVHNVRNLIYDFKKEADIYYYGEKNGFDNYNEFKTAISKLFLTADDYRVAIKKGFTNGAEYTKAKEMGFDNPKEFEEALKLNIETKSEYDTYCKLREIMKKYDLETTEEALLFKILLDLNPKKKISAEKIWSKLTSEETKYKLKGDWYHERFAEWFSKKFNDKNDLKEYLAESKKMVQIGYYDIEGEVFERKVVPQVRKIIVDGSNVAWAGGSRDKGDKPYAKNIKLVIDALREGGYSDILVIIDASLNHLVEDVDILLYLKKEKTLKEAPAKRDADEFILKYLKEYSAYVITNDTFKDWKEKDEWVNENIEKYRVSFMINENVVKFDEKIEKIGE